MSGDALAGLLDGAALPDTGELIDRGRALANTVTVGPCPFLTAPRHCLRGRLQARVRRVTGRLMQHAQIGWRSLSKSRDAYARIHGECAARVA
jgi:hypothetical protein